MQEIPVGLSAKSNHFIPQKMKGIDKLWQAIWLFSKTLFVDLLWLFHDKGIPTKQNLSNLRKSIFVY